MSCDDRCAELEKMVDMVEQRAQSVEEELTSRDELVISLGKQIVMGQARGSYDDSMDDRDGNGSAGGEPMRSWEGLETALVTRAGDRHATQTATQPQV